MLTTIADTIVWLNRYQQELTRCSNNKSILTTANLRNGRRRCLETDETHIMVIVIQSAGWRQIASIVFL